MVKIQGEMLVCSAEYSKRLIDLGVESVCNNCYEYNDAEKMYEYAGEYMGQDNWLPAWTMEELFVAIGGEWVKPDLFTQKEWTPIANMMQYAYYNTEKRIDFKKGSDAAAAMLISLIETKQEPVIKVNERLRAYAEQKFYNTVVSDIEKNKFKS